MTARCSSRTAASPRPTPDPNLVNAWGIAFNPTGFVWVNNQGTGKATLYDGNGVPQSLVVTVPGPAAGVPSNPSGIVFSGGAAKDLGGILEEVKAIRDGGGTGSIIGLDERVHAKIDGENCYGPAKLRMVEEWLAKSGLGRGHVRFYSDHASDAPVFEWADEAVAVNPHDKLARLARERGWAVEDWR